MPDLPPPAAAPNPADRSPLQPPPADPPAPAARPPAGQPPAGPSPLQPPPVQPPPADLWDAEPGYLNTASYGLPPRPAWDALQAALADWRAGRTAWEPWAATVGRARESFARLVCADPADVATAATVSQLVGLVADALPPGATVLAPDIEFTSNLFPWLVQADRGVRVRTVPVDRLADAIDARTTVVACSAVQSATGAVADLAAIGAAAREHGALVAVDATQAVGWLAVDARDVDVLTCSAYKWLMSPRGTAFMVISPALRERVRPIGSGWFAGQDVPASFYGPPLRLATDARRYDQSPAWHCWVGTAAALDVVERIGVDAIGRHNLALANRFRAGLGLSESDSAIVSVDRPGADTRLAAAGIRAATRAGSLRASFHIYNTTDDVDQAVAALTGQPGS
jgi:selenocysteine lyase/cysteine desulfurase